MSSSELEITFPITTLPFTFLGCDLEGITISSPSSTALSVVAADGLRILLPALDLDIILFDFRVGFVMGSISESSSGGVRVEDWRRRGLIPEYDAGSKAESESESGFFEDFEIVLECFVDFALYNHSAFGVKRPHYITYLITGTGCSARNSGHHQSLIQITGVLTQ